MNCQLNQLKPPPSFLLALICSPLLHSANGEDFLCNLPIKLRLILKLVVSYMEGSRALSDGNLYILT